MPTYHRVTSAVRHYHRRATSGELPGKPSTPTDAARRVECNSVDATVGNLTDGELSWVNYHALLLCVLRGGPIDRGPQLSACVGFDFLIYFPDLNACFKNSYLKLGVSNFGEPNFVGFHMKCSI